MVSMAKTPRTGATRTLTRLARIHSHTYINTVTTAWCEAPVQLLQNMESNFMLKVSEGGGENRSTRIVVVGAAAAVVVVVVVISAASFKLFSSAAL